MALDVEDRTVTAVAREVEDQFPDVAEMVAEKLDAPLGPISRLQQMSEMFEDGGETEEEGVGGGQVDREGRGQGRGPMSARGPASVEERKREGEGRGGRRRSSVLQRLTEDERRTLFRQARQSVEEIDLKAVRDVLTGGALAGMDQEEENIPV